MKKIICILLAVILAVSVAVLSVGAVNSKDDYSKMITDGKYNPSDSYTVDENVPTCEEAIVACGGSLDEVQYIYFQLPEEDPSNPSSYWTNKFNTLPGTDYCQVCAYWWGGIGKEWPDGSGVKWVGYRATLVDKANRIYRAALPGDGDTPLVVWNNGVNGGMDDTAEIFNYARQMRDVNIEGCEPGDEDTLPEGTPDPDTADGCISIIDWSVSQQNALTGFYNYGSNLYVYYGNGCYGNYFKGSDNFYSVARNDLNPDHHQCDVDFSGAVESADATAIQRHLAEKVVLDDANLKLADPDADKVVSIMDATRIQRYLAEICNIDGSKPYSAEANAYLNTVY